MMPLPRCYQSHCLQTDIIYYSIYTENQLYLGIIVSRFIFAFAQRTPFQIRQSKYVKIPNFQQTTICRACFRFNNVDDNRQRLYFLL